MARTKNNISAHRYRKPPGRHVQSTNLPSASDCHTILLKASRGHLCRQLQGLSGLVCPYLSGSSLRIQPNIVTRFRNFFFTCNTAICVFFSLSWSSQSIPKAFKPSPSALLGVVAKRGAWACVEWLGLGNKVQSASQWD